MQIKNILLAFSFLMVLGGMQSLSAQDSQETVVKGRIYDAETKEPLVGVAVWVKDTPHSSMSDLDGNYELRFTGNYGYVTFSLLGYAEKEVAVKKGGQVINVALEEDMNTLEEAVAVGYGSQKRASIIGSISTVDPISLQVPVSNVSSALAGRVSGVISYKRSGEPGEATTFFIRGIGTFGENNQPLVLVDGVERDLDLVDVEDIKEFSILKDASATAVYGVRGANGVVLVTTRKGEEGKAKVNVKYQAGIVSPTKVPEVASGAQFMEMYNYALESNGSAPYFDRNYIDAVNSGIDPDLYPNVDWTGSLFKKLSSSHRANVNVSGGTNSVKYYLSGGFYNEDGLFRNDPALNYNTSTFYRRFNFRANVNVTLTEHTDVDLSLATTFEQKNQGGTDATAIWSAGLRTPGVLFPMQYSNGQPSGPSANGENPYSLLTQTGYRQSFWNNAQSVVAINHDFSWFLEGLKGTVKGSFDANNSHTQNRTRTPAIYGNAYRDGDGVLHTTQFVEGSQTLSFSRGSTGWRALYLEANLNFARSFGKHGITAMLLYQMSGRNYVGDSATDSNAALPYRHQGLAARLTYNYAGRYFFEFNAGYNGSENFSPGHRFGFFPSVALGYMISEEPFWQPLKNVVSQLKLRGSYGLVGNDQIGGGRRFIYLETVDKDFGSYVFGVTSNTQSATRLGDVANPNVGWETSRKLDLGVDIQLFNSLKLQVDYFHEYRTGIFTQMATLPYYAGYHVRPYTNSGKMRNTGWDMSATFDRQFGEVYVSALANFTFSRNVILDMNSPDWEELYLNQAGQARYESYGYVAAGLFKDEEDIASWPDQTAVAGKVYPGDIRYLDLNCDGVVNSYDMKPLGSTGIPEIVYGFGASASWKGFDVSLFFQGVGNISLNTYSSLTCGFIQNSIYRNNLLADVYGNYWTPDNPDAKYPRLSVNAGSNNNSVRSTFWQQDGSYLRLKNAEIGYSLPKRLVNKAGLQTVRFFVAGDNLLTFSKFKLWDPDQNDANGVFQYPINRTGTIGVNLVF